MRAKVRKDAADVSWAVRIGRPAGPLIWRQRRLGGLAGMASSKKVLRHAGYRVGLADRADAAERTAQAVQRRQRRAARNSPDASNVLSLRG